jgi:lipopolysaccharide biosynthesis regulator YciM
MQTIIIKRPNGSDLKITAQDTSKENIARILEHVRQIEGSNAPVARQATPCQQQQARHNGDYVNEAVNEYMRAYRSIAENPAASFWLKEAAYKLSDRDPVDALHDVETLLDLCKLRLQGVQS